MDPGRQDPVADIEAALAAIRHAGGPRRPSGPPFGGGGGGPHGHHGPSFGVHHGRGRFGDLGARFRMLDALLGGPNSVSELAEAIGVDQPRASRLVADAAHRGMVERHPDPADARRIVVELTAAGRTMLEGVKSSRRSRVEAALDSFTPDERAAFAALLGRFAAALGNRDGV